MPADLRPFRRRVVLALLGVTVLMVTACANFQDAKDWDAKAKTHFVEACTGESGVENSTTTVLASEDFCECVFTDLKNVHKLEWEKMLEFEQTLERVDGDTPPTVPAQVTKALDACAREGTAGPEAPSGGDSKATTTTEG